MAKNDGDQRVLATAQHIVRTLGKNEQLTEDMIRILSTFDDRFSNMTGFIHENHTPSISSALRKMEESLGKSEETVRRWESRVVQGGVMIWGDASGNLQEADAYVKAVDELYALTRAPWAEKEFVARAQGALAIAVPRLKEEFRCLLVLNSESVDGDWLMYYTHHGNRDEIQSGVAYSSSDDDDENDDDDDKEIPVAHPVSEFNALFDPVPPERARDLNTIIRCMARIGAVQECSKVYVNVRKTVLEQSLYRLGLERPNPELIQKMSWEVLEVKIRKWIQALKVGVQVIFSAEKRLCDVVFTGLSGEGEAAFEELASDSFMQFLLFGKVVVMTRRTPEKLFRVLDMYEVLKELLPDISSCFRGEGVRSEIRTVLGNLGEAARGILHEFEIAIQKDAAKTPVAGGAFHPLTRYVMNYIKFLVEYTASLEQLLRGRKREVPRSLGVETFGLSEGLMENTRNDSERLSPLAVQVMWLIVHLERNLEGKSKLYSDPAMTFLFLMNNVHYILQKVKQSEVATLLGDGWIRKHSAQVRVYAENYVRTAWQRVFSYLRDFNGRLASGISRFAMKERLKNFNLTFEEVCGAQRNAVVPDPQLREELRITIAERLIPDYHSFVERFRNCLETERQLDKYLKYTSDDLENCVIDLFDSSR